MRGTTSPSASSLAAHNRMVANRRRDTKPERLLRSALHRKGLRFRVDAPPLQGVRRRADIVFVRAKVAVFIDGCFWHGCPIHWTKSKSNTEFWDQKIAMNRERDRETNERLEGQGWMSIRVWEHEPIDESAEVIRCHVRSRSCQGLEGRLDDTRE